MTSLSNRLDNLTETVAGLKANLDSCQSQANDLKKSVKFTLGEVQDLKPFFPKLAEVEKEICLVKDSITLHQNKLEALENHSMRNNIRVNGLNGIHESAEGETWESIESKGKDVTSDKLGIDADIERTHPVERKPRQQHGNQSHPTDTWEVCYPGSRGFSQN